MNSDVAKTGIQMQAITNFLLRIPAEQYPIEVRWGRPRRTNRQNRYLWGVVYKTFAEGMSEQSGELVKPEWIHDLCRQHFLPRFKVPGTDKTVPMSTTDLCRSGNEQAFQDYVEQIMALAAHKGIFIPDPDPEVAK